MKPSTAKARTITPRPNILYIFTDQQSGDAMSCAGNHDLSTPAMDEIAARGVRFDCAYTSFPLCVPARTSMFTGRFPHEVNVRDNHPTPRAGLPFPMLGRLMTDGGYESHYVGKWHIPSVAEADTATHGFDEVVFGGGYGDLDRRKTGEAVSFLERPHQRPFFLVVSYNNPHDCCELSRGDPLRMGEIPSPPRSGLPDLPANHAVPEGEPEVLREFQREFRRCLLADQWDETRTREYAWGYDRLVEMVDREIGELLRALDRSGHADDTLVIFSSDHGDGRGRHRWNQKWSLYDESARVPFLIAPPGGAATVGVLGYPVSATLDLMSTILDYADLSIPEGCRGASLRRTVETGESPAREYVVSETDLSEPEVIPERERHPGRMVRTDRYKYIAFDRGEHREQLFDMSDDPGEMRNLVAGPRFAPELRRHREMLRSWCRRTGDDFPVGTPGGE